MKQSMSSIEAQRRIDFEAQKVARRFKDGVITLEAAHKQLEAGIRTMSLFQIAAYAKAIACFQCSAD